MTTPKEAASWSLVSELIRAFPDWRVFHTHPGGGQYDCLTIVDDGDSPSIRIDVNRRGSVHARSQSSDGQNLGFSDSEWFESLMQGVRPRDLAREIAESIGLLWPDSAPASTRWSITYRVIAHAVVSESGSRHPLEAATWIYDSSDAENGYLIARTPHRELESLRPNDVWVLLDGETPRSWIWNGWLWTATQERLNLFARYRRGATVASLAAQLVDLSYVSPSADASPPWVLG